MEVLISVGHDVYFFFPQRAKERDARKAKAKEKKLHGEKEALLAAIKVSILLKLT